MAPKAKTKKAGIETHIESWSDQYFLKTKAVVERFGDVDVTYAVFMRRPVIFAPRLVVTWLEDVAQARGFAIGITLNYDEGQWAGAGEPLAYIRGPLSKLVDLETLYLQKLGTACVAANNAFTACVAAAFICSTKPWTMVVARASLAPFAVLMSIGAGSLAAGGGAGRGCAACDCAGGGTAAGCGYANGGATGTAACGATAV